MNEERSECPSSSAMPRLAQCSASFNMSALAQSWDKAKEAPSADAAFGLRVHEAMKEGTAKFLQSDEERLAFSVMQRQKAQFVKAWMERAQK